MNSSDIDIRGLASLIIELNIAFRNYKSYPKGHPVIEGAFLKVKSTYNKLLETHDEITIGVAKDTLLFGTTILDKSNVVFRDFARILFTHGIGVLTLMRGITLRELENFCIILGLKRDEVNRHGGIEALWGKAKITSLAIKAYRYDLFSTARSDNDADDVPSADAGGVWERFARGLMAGAIISRDDSNAAEIDPEFLASILNSQYEEATEDGREPSYVQAVSSNIRRECSRQSISNLPYKELAAFVDKLNPDLRFQFLNSTFGLSTANGSNVTENILRNMSADAIIESLEEFNRKQAIVPPMIMGLLQKLSVHAIENPSAGHLDHVPEIDFQDKIRTIFKEHASEEFIPDDYQRNLNTFLTEEQIPRMIKGDLDELLATVESNVVENRIGDIIMNLLLTGYETPEERDFLIQSLSDMFGLFLQIGDYGQLVKMIDNLSGDSVPSDVQNCLRETYTRREFLDEILDGLRIWGKPRFHDIQILIEKIREPFIEVLLDHLASEDSLSLRRFFIDRLIEMGPITRSAISSRLNDKRWFVLRNLIIILKANNDASIIPLIRPLTLHANNRVRHEALSTLIMLHDTVAEMAILKDLDSRNREVQFAAIKLSENSSMPEIHKKLIAILTKSGLSQAEYELKSAVVKTLGTLRQAEALPVFTRILGSGSLFHKKLLTSLKINIITALELYPRHMVLPILERLYIKKNEIGRQAQKSLGSFKVKANEH